MRSNCIIAGLAVILVAGCRTVGGNRNSPNSTLRDDGETPAVADTEPIAGLDIVDNTPAITQLASDVQSTTDWEFSSGREYWLYSSRGKYMTFSADGYYAPYQNAAACEGKTNDPTSACSVKPDNVARACQRIASRTLKALMTDEPEEYKQMKQTYGGSFSLFGWMNDAHSDKQYAVQTWQQPFIWRGDSQSVTISGACPGDFKTVSGYIKWVSSVSPNGRCLTPSKGQLMALLQKASQCLQQNNQNNQSP